MGAQLGSIVHIACFYVFRLNNCICSGSSFNFNAVYINIGISISCYSRVFRFRYIVLPVTALRFRDQRPCNINLHIVLNTGLQHTVYIHKVIVFLADCRNTLRIGSSFAVLVLAEEQPIDRYRVFLNGFLAIFRRHVNIAHRSGAAGIPHRHLLVVLQV